MKMEITVKSRFDHYVSLLQKFTSFHRLIFSVYRMPNSYSLDPVAARVHTLLENFAGVILAGREDQLDEIFRQFLAHQILIRRTAIEYYIEYENTPAECVFFDDVSLRTGLFIEDVKYFADLVRMIDDIQIQLLLARYRNLSLVLDFDLREFFSTEEIRIASSILFPWKNHRLTRFKTLLLKLWIYLCREMAKSFNDSLTTTLRISRHQNSIKVSSSLSRAIECDEIHTLFRIDRINQIFKLDYQRLFNEFWVILIFEISFTNSLRLDD